jgi:hypothetical protein
MPMSGIALHEEPTEADTGVGLCLDGVTSVQAIRRVMGNRQL